MRRFATYLAASAVMLLLAAAPVRAQQIPLQDKPFAEHKVVLQLSESDPKKAGLVISVANLFAEAILSIHRRESVSRLFDSLEKAEGAIG